MDAGVFQMSPPRDLTETGNSSSVAVKAVPDFFWFLHPFDRAATFLVESLKSQLQPLVELEYLSLFRRLVCCSNSISSSNCQGGPVLLVEALRHHCLVPAASPPAYKVHLLCVSERIRDCFVSFERSFKKLDILLEIQFSDISGVVFIWFVLDFPFGVCCTFLLTFYNKIPAYVFPLIFIDSF
jgi:hypothetical protein